MASVSALLRIACVANVLKNKGLSTTSASRAAIHQSFTVTGNLADITANKASQCIASGLLGTVLGIALSSVLHHGAGNSCAGFLVLAVLHQGCNNAALQSVSLRHFNRHRLCIALQQYDMKYDDDNSVLPLTPDLVDKLERCLPFFKQAEPI
jgi:hypothetical protein